MKDINKIRALCKALFQTLRTERNCQIRSLFQEIDSKLINIIDNHTPESRQHNSGEIDQIDHSSVIKLKNFDENLIFHPIIKPGEKFYVRTIFFRDSNN